VEVSLWAPDDSFRPQADGENPTPMTPM